MDEASSLPVMPQRLLLVKSLPRTAARKDAPAGRRWLLSSVQPFVAINGETVWLVGAMFARVVARRVPGSIIRCRLPAPIGFLHRGGFLWLNALLAPQHRVPVEHIAGLISWLYRLRF